MIIRETNIVPLFVSWDELQRTEAEIMQNFHAEIDAAEKLYLNTHAVLRRDAEALAKIDAADLNIAKAAADRLLAENAKHATGAVTLAKAKAENIGLMALRDALLKRNRRLFGLDALSKRSARHAAAMARRSAGN